MNGSFFIVMMAGMCATFVSKVPFHRGMNMNDTQKKFLEYIAQIQESCVEGWLIEHKSGIKKKSELCCMMLLMSLQLILWN